MRKRLILGALVGAMGLVLPARTAAQQAAAMGGPAVLPNIKNDQFRNVPANAKTPTKANSLKRVTEFLTTPIIQVAAFVGIRKEETKPAYQIKRERMYEKRRQQREEDRMEMRLQSHR